MTRLQRMATHSASASPGSIGLTVGPKLVPLLLRLAWSTKIPRWSAYPRAEVLATTHHFVILGTAALAIGWSPPIPATPPRHNRAVDMATFSPAWAGLLLVAPPNERPRLRRQAC